MRQPWLGSDASSRLNPSSHLHMELPASDCDSVGHATHAPNPVLLLYVSAGQAEHFASVVFASPSAEKSCPNEVTVYPRKQEQFRMLVLKLGDEENSGHGTHVCSCPRSRRKKPASQASDSLAGRGDVSREGAGVVDWCEEVVICACVAVAGDIISGPVLNGGGGVLELGAGDVVMAAVGVAVLDGCGVIVMEWAADVVDAMDSPAAKSQHTPTSSIMSQKESCHQPPLGQSCTVSSAPVHCTPFVHA